MTTPPVTSTDLAYRIERHQDEYKVSLSTHILLDEVKKHLALLSQNDDRDTLLRMSATISASAFGPSWRKKHDEIAKQAVALARAIIAEVDATTLSPSQES